MEQHALSTAQRNSAAYLRKLLKEYQNLTWDNTYKTLSTGADVSTADYQLLVSSQMLTADQLAGIAAKLSPVLQVGTMFLHPHDSLLNATVVGCNLSHVEDDKQRVMEQIDTAAAQYHCEVALVSRHSPVLSEPGLLVMDMDSTVIQIECIDEIAKLAGLGEQVSEVTERAMRGELDFKQSLRTRVECLRGVKVSQLAQIRAAIPLMPGLQNLLDVLQQHGWKIAIASGGFTYFAGYLEQRLGLDASRANELEEHEGILTGNVVGEIVDAEVKAQTVEALAAQWQIPLSQTVAMGDGANDLKMMKVAGLGVAFEAKPVVNAQADVAIRYSGLDTLLAYLR